MPEITVVMLSFNRRDDLREGLLRMFSQEYSDFEVIVADNCSSDGTKEMVTEEFPQVRFMEMESNIGVAACNRAFDAAKGKYVIILDDDSFPEQSAMRRMVEVFESNPEAGAVAFDVRNYYKYDEISDQKAPLTISEAKSTKYLLGFNGAGVGIRQSVLQTTGGYPEEFFLYWNEQDLAIKIMNLGYKIVEVPDIISYHKYSPKNRDSERGPFFYTRNLYWIIWKYFPLSKIITMTCKLIFLSVFYSFTQKTTVYLKATYNAVINSSQIWPKRIKIKKKIVSNLRIAIKLAFILYR